MNYLDLFSMHNLALLSDWLEETGELYVDVCNPHSGSSGYFVRSIEGFKRLLSHFSQYNSPEIVFTVFRRLQYPLRGVANQQLLEQALEQIPDGSWFHIKKVILEEGFEFCSDIGSGQGHTELRQEMQEVLGETLAVGVDIVSHVEWAELKRQNEIFEVAVTKSQNWYKSYRDNPERYQWIEEIWKA